MRTSSRSLSLKIASVLCACLAAAPAFAQSSFKRGDVNCDGCVDLGDAALLEYLFLMAPPPCCFDAADANDNGRVDIADMIHILDYVCISMPSLPAPGPIECGSDPTPGDPLGCTSYPQQACPVRCNCVGVGCDCELTWREGCCEALHSRPQGKIFLAWEVSSPQGGDCCASFIIKKDYTEIARLPASAREYEVVPCEQGMYQVQCVSPEGCLGRTVYCQVSDCGVFRRGDVNCDGCVDDQDPRSLIEYLEGRGPEPCCMDAADANDDSLVDAADAAFLSAWVGGNGPPPPSPGPFSCGSDNSEDGLSCGYPEEACALRCEDSCYPPAGEDVMASSLFHEIDIPGIGLCRADLTGDLRVSRSDPRLDSVTGLRCIDTRIVEMQLGGSDPVCGRILITLSPFQASIGGICERVAGTCFPADSWFEVWIRVELPDIGMCLYSCAPANMRCVIEQIPPFGCLYNLDVGAGGPVPLQDGPCQGGTNPCAVVPLPPPAATILKAVHEPRPPQACACFPEAGEDTLATSLVHAIEIPGLNLTCSEFTGPIVIRRSEPSIDPDGRCRIDTEMVRLEMTGTCLDGTPATLRLSPEAPSKGFIVSQGAGGSCFPADSGFHVYFELTVSLPGAPAVFRNCEPAVMGFSISALPPIGGTYALRNAPVPIFTVTPGDVSPCLVDPPPPPAGYLSDATHVPQGEIPTCCPEYGPGRDIFPSNLMHEIEIPGVGLCNATLSGPVEVYRGRPYTDPSTGLCCVETEMIDMRLEGVDDACGPLVVTLDPRRPSRQRICQLDPDPGACFPAKSCFEMYVRVEAVNLGRTLVACVPAEMCCEISSIPPYTCLYSLNIGQDLDAVPLFEEIPGQDVCRVVPQGPPVALIKKAVHEPVSPCSCFPQEGDDLMGSTLSHTVRVFGLEVACEADLKGPLLVRRSAPYLDPVSRLCTIDTEIVEMELRGIDPVCGPLAIRLDPERPSRGRIVQKADHPDACYPADSYFDVFVEVVAAEQGLILSNCAPARMECVVEAIPPLGCVYQLNLSGVPLYRPSECGQLPDPAIDPSGVIEAARHTPTPCIPARLSCAPQPDGTVLLEVAGDPSCPCEYTVTRSGLPGDPFVVCRGSSFSLPLSCTDAPCGEAAAGALSLEYCVICEHPDGTTETDDCCKVQVVCPGGSVFKRGDVNCDGCVGGADGKALAEHITMPGMPPLCCPDAADANDDGIINIGDVVFLLTFSVNFGEPPPAPGPQECGPDPSGDDLDCPDYPQAACGVTDCGELQFPGDCNQDGALDISDAVCLLGFLFLGNPDELPCADDASNLELFDFNGDGMIDISDSVAQLNFLFLGGSTPHVCIDPSCKQCIRVRGCPFNPTLVCP